MIISKGLSMKKLTLYPLAQPIEDKLLWVEDSCVEDPYLIDEVVQHVLTIAQSMKFKEDIAENFVNYHISHPEIS